MKGGPSAAASRQAASDAFVFDFERLQVYQDAVVSVAACSRTTGRWSVQTDRAAGGQLPRAAVSVVANLAEGSGKRTPKEKALAYRQALTSGRECVALLTIARRIEARTEDAHQELRESCISLCRQVGGFIRSLKARREP